ncbi:MAG: hypothetical protein HUJ29_06225 [Gammaproteobacteria bacterium]|nr:hypothetical protein [Gammaproteobacteria bacterium]
MLKIFIVGVSTILLWIIINYGYLLIEHGKYGSYTQFESEITPEDGEIVTREFYAHGTFDNYYLGIVFHLPEEMTDDDAYDLDFFSKTNEMLKAVEVTVSDDNGRELKGVRVDNPNAFDLGGSRNGYSLMWQLKLKSMSRYNIKLVLPNGFFRELGKYTPIVVHISRNPISTP